MTACAAGDATEADPSLLDATTVIERLGADVVNGLTTGEAARRRADSGPNAVADVAAGAEWQRLIAQFCSPLVYLLLAALAVSVMVWIVEGADGWPFDALVIGAIVIFNGLLGYAQERHARRAAEALTGPASGSATVIRGGLEQRIPVRDVVPGDLLVLVAGDTVAADARVVVADALKVSESELNGQPEPVAKTSDILCAPVESDDRTNMVYQGTAVTDGEGRAVVTATAAATRMGRITALVHRMHGNPSQLQRQIAWVSKVLGAVVGVIALVVVTTVIGVFGIHNLHDAVTVVLFGVSLAVAAIPEGLPALISAVLALGMRRMADRGAIVKDLASVETLGSASVVCTGKTGTLTTGDLAIARFVSPVGEVTAIGAGSGPDKTFDAHPYIGKTALNRIQTALIAGIGSCAGDAQLDHRDDALPYDSDPLGTAFTVAAARLGAQGWPVEEFVRVGVGGFCDGGVTGTLATGSRPDGETIGAFRGDPEALLLCCTGVLVGNRIDALDDKWTARIRGEAERITADGLTAHAVAYRIADVAPRPLDAEEAVAAEDLIYLGLVGISDPLRPEAAGAVAAAHRAGVRVIMITGDRPGGAARVARELGIGDEQVAVTGAALEDLDDGALRRTVRRHSQFSNLTPEHKLRIVEALHADHEVVAVTGEGVNDAPALKSADIGIAMGRTGTDVAREAANMILVDDNFATLVAAIRLGRGIFANIRKFLRYLLSSNMGEILTVFFGVALAGVIGLTDSAQHLALPLLPTQILWINLLTDGAPAMAMGVDPHSDELMDRPARPRSVRIVDRRMWLGIVVIGAVMATATLVTIAVFLRPSSIVPNPSLDQARTAGFTVLVLAQLFNTLNARSATRTAFRGLFANRWLWAAIVASALLQATVVQWSVLNPVFGTVPLSGGQWVVCVAAAGSVLCCGELLKAVLRRTDRRRQARRSRRSPA